MLSKYQIVHLKMYTYLIAQPSLVLLSCLRRTSWDLKDLDKLGIDLETSLAVMTLAPPPVDSVVVVVQAPMDALNQLDAAVDFILPLSPTSPSKAGSHNLPPPLSPLLIQLRTVSKMTVYGERLGDDAMGIQGI